MSQPTPGEIRVSRQESRNQTPLFCVACNRYMWHISTGIDEWRCYADPDPNADKRGCGQYRDWRPGEPTT